MGQKVHPIGFRTGVSKSHTGEWFAKSKRDSATMFVEDIKIRKLIDSYYKRSGISKIIIRKTIAEGEILCFTAKPAIILGKEGFKLKKCESQIKKLTGKNFKIVLKEVKNPELSARIMADFIATQIEGRTPYRRVCKNMLDRIMDKGAEGIKIQIGGRLNGADMASVAKFSKGRIPLQTIRADIDYYYTTAMTKYGILGIKVWICKGEVFSKEKN